MAVASAENFRHPDITAQVSEPPSSTFNEVHEPRIAQSKSRSSSNLPQLKTETSTELRFDGPEHAIYPTSPNGYQKESNNLTPPSKSIDATTAHSGDNAPNNSIKRLPGESEPSLLQRDDSGFQFKLKAGEHVGSTDYTKIMGTKGANIICVGDYRHASDGVKQEFGKLLDDLAADGVPKKLTAIGLEGLSPEMNEQANQYLQLKRMGLSTDTPRIAALRSNLEQHFKDFFQDDKTTDGLMKMVDKIAEQKNLNIYGLEPSSLASESMLNRLHESLEVLPDIATIHGKSEKSSALLKKFFQSPADSDEAKMAEESLKQVLFESFNTFKASPLSEYPNWPHTNTTEWVNEQIALLKDAKAGGFDLSKLETFPRPYNDDNFAAMDQDWRNSSWANTAVKWSQEHPNERMALFGGAPHFGFRQGDAQTVNEKIDQVPNSNQSISSVVVGYFGGDLNANKSPNSHPLVGTLIDHDGKLADDPVFTDINEATRNFKQTKSKTAVYVDNPREADVFIHLPE